MAAHLTVLPDGRLLSWTSNDLDHSFHTPNVYLWNPATWDPSTTPTFTQVPNVSTDVFCAAHSFMADGRLFVAGGHIENDAGSRNANFFNYQGTGTWARTMDMRAGRWYPTTATMGNGDIVVAAGADEHHGTNPYPEVWDGSKFRLLGGAPLDIPYYPWLHLGPDGRIFSAGPDETTRYLNPSGDGEWTTYGRTVSGVHRNYGTSILYEPGKVLIIGGGDPPIAKAEVVDLNAGTGWRSTGDMQYARRQFNANILADGKVLVTGGTSAPGFNNESGAVLAPEIWNPATGSWTTLANMPVPRMYHSTAVLLPDARVLTAGGGRCADCTVDRLDAEIFSPPYLFNADGSVAARPTITSVPNSIGRGQTLTITTPDAATISRVTLVRLPSTTHGFNMNQGFMALKPTTGAGAVSVTTPASANVLPAGHYMLFILNGTGVPSVAKVIQLTGTAGAPVPPTTPAPPTSLSAAAASGPSTDLTWTDNSTSESAFRIERCQGVDCTSFTEVATVTANTTRYTDAGLTAGASYGYRVRASNSTGSSGYSNLVRSTAVSPAVGPAVNRSSARCMTVPGGSRQNGTQVTIQDCQQVEQQVWTMPPTGVAGEIRVYGDQCLDGDAGGDSNGDRMIIYTCWGGSNQRWTRTAAGEIRNFTGTLCVELANKATANGTGLVLWTCDGTASQKWDGTPGEPVTNTPPVASFTHSCVGAACTFTNTSTDPGGSVASSRWTFGDGQTSTVASPSHTYAAGGTYSVALTVTDDKGATNGVTESVAVAPFTLTASGSKVKGNQVVELKWTSVTAARVDYYRDGVVIPGSSPSPQSATTGAYTDNLNRKGGGSYKYKVCTTGSTAVCSAEQTVTF